MATAGGPLPPAGQPCAPSAQRTPLLALLQACSSRCQGPPRAAAPPPPPLPPAVLARAATRADPHRRRLWIVRMPRPPEAPAIKVLEQEVDTYRTQMSLITEALNVKKVRAAGCCRVV